MAAARALEVTAVGAGPGVEPGLIPASTPGQSGAKRRPGTDAQRSGRCQEVIMRIGSLAQQNVLFWASRLAGAAVAVAVPNGGSRACGVTPTATFGDGVAVAVMVWHDCVRAVESGGLPACIHHRRARSFRGRSGGPGRGPGSAPPASVVGCILGGKAPGNVLRELGQAVAPPPLTWASRSETAAARKSE